MPNKANPSNSLAVVYLARGADDNALLRFKTFAASYRNRPAGTEHDLFVIYKGSRGSSQLTLARTALKELQHTAIYTDDFSFDIGAYRAALETIRHKYVCFLNTNSEIVSDAWLYKLAVNASLPHVGLATSTGSFESLSAVDGRFPPFPNVHARSNAFVLERELGLHLFPSRIVSKVDAWLLESGENSFTRCVFGRGKTVVVVGSNGRGYEPQWWPQSDTFRSRNQSNLIVHDNVTRLYESAIWPEKQASILRTWGTFLDGSGTAVLPP